MNVRTRKGHALPPACLGPWHVVLCLANCIVLLRCGTCGNEAMVFRAPVEE